jgi:hypothetical protein
MVYIYFSGNYKKTVSSFMRHTEIETENASQ